ncbi:lipase/acyltransferase domain-containing protein [Actinokineospora bangkokensis]|uniref:Lysophospholipase-3 n=1 Tax=Actinokineospora bangkokensis TaxID=1193682 RepID=A0A1Q9LK22_9PSEU|nr:hypothetical protein [Actinokineospora bangkokensis]OLR92344.1 hypothetical protein BJP25_19815 [Actinokineospora bangkokensis]
MTKWARIALVALVAAAGLTGTATAATAGQRAPVVLFPAFHLNKLEVLVHDQRTAPQCPRSGRFEDWYQNDQPAGAWSQVCRDQLLTLRYRPTGPMATRFSEQPGVEVRLKDYGKTSSAPAYSALYQRLEAEGYVRDKDIRVAGYDARLTPDLGGFLPRTTRLVEDTYRANGGRPVELVGHSNGPLYIQYLLTHTTQAWKDKYVRGFTPIAGNFPGQGLLYPTLFTGLNIQDFGYPKTLENARSSARMYLSLPSTYMSASDPRVFGDREVVVVDQSTGRSYTPKDFPRLLSDAGLRDAEQIARYYVGFVEFTSPRAYPQVDVHAEKGSGVDTLVGARLPDLRVGQLITPAQFLTRDGDGNQEDITNDAVAVWSAMRCHTFSLTDNPGVDHFSLPSHAPLLDRLVTTLRTRPTRC